MKRYKVYVIALCAVVLAISAWTITSAYDQYTEADGVINSNCGACHGDFRNNSYVSSSDGQNWGNLHNVHRSDMNADCDVCHAPSGRNPVLLGSSTGLAPGILDKGCAGCHGREEDGTGAGTEGWSAGLRQHHYRAGVTVCGECHERADLGGLTDANPLYFIPVGENVLPEYYDEPSAAIEMPDDPCSAGGNESYAGASIGLDNDGDGFSAGAVFPNYDGDDFNCGAVATPGEPSRNSAKLGQGLNPVTVVRAGANLDVSFDPACSASNHRISYGPLDQVANYVYSGQACGIGNSGSFNWAPPAGNLFFLVVGNDASSEGGYGYNSGLDLDGDGSVDVERPEDSTSAICPLPQDVTSRCEN